MEMASRLFQSIVLQMKDTVDRTIGIVDASGAVVACTDLPRIGEMREEAITELGFAGEIVRFGGYTYHITGDRSSRLEYAVFVQGEDELARSICSLVAVSINNIKTLYRILDDRVEALEFTVHEKSAATGVPLSQLHLKKNLLLCCITRGHQILIPRGGDQIQVGDNVIVVTLEHGLHDLRDILDKGAEG